jgi:putative DNA primase/helicase
LDARALRFLERFQDLRHALLIPMRDRDGVICNLQGIDGDGQKRFVTGATTKGAFAVLNSPVLRWERGIAAERIAIGEGFASVAAFVQLHPEFLGIAAMSCRNLPAIAEYFREKFPLAELVIAADQDAAGIGAAADARDRTGAELRFPGRDGCKDWADVLALECAHE